MATEMTPAPARNAPIKVTSNMTPHMPTHSKIHINDGMSLRSISRLGCLGRRWVLAAFAVLAVAAPVQAEMQLLMFEEAGCVWCARWHAEVGDAYALTPEGQAAPLQQLDLHDGVPEAYVLVSRPRFTPTFVLVRDGAELGRIEGYPGEDFFWGLLGRLIEENQPPS